MVYDFDTPINRRNTGSLKWDVEENELPLWVADMDFQTAPAVREAIEERARHGVFGYSIVTLDWYRAYASWWERRHGLKVEEEELIFCTGVVPAISSMVRKLTTPNENVLICTPVYNIFFNSIINNGRRVLECPLRYENGEYDVDFGDLEKKLSDPQTTLMILCNPHNPVGKIWDEDTLSKIGELCQKYGVVVISDEIHCDLTAPGREYVPFSSVSDACRFNSVTCVAPTKAFNLAGLQSAAVIVPNKFLRHKVWRALNTDEVAEPNDFAISATVAAFDRGEDWLEALRRYLYENRLEAERFFAEKLPMMRLIKAEATYLLWVDCSAVTSDSEKFASFIRRETGLYICEGAEYGEAGRTFLRINAACPRETLLRGLELLAVGTEKYMKR